MLVVEVFVDSKEKLRKINVGLNAMIQWKMDRHCPENVKLFKIMCIVEDLKDVISRPNPMPGEDY